jgi:hypothetical protein
MGTWKFRQCQLPLYKHKLIYAIIMGHILIHYCTLINNKPIYLKYEWNGSSTAICSARIELDPTRVPDTTTWLLHMVQTGAWTSSLIIRVSSMGNEL